ncbi:hypothetical protein BSL78_00982 [Apostichopus japonicus]|uniref:Peptidase A2 domain-containing protein n=1 Tax=Stichopus japonicus TaxID=307972 RepID=A0A2G8LPA3_STIJA|nr:hypothetical protein BSL78_00982 [Apostichopus japonicus]
MAFEVKEFLKSPSFEAIDSLKKSELKLLSEHFGIPVKGSMLKLQIRDLILEHMVDEEMLEESCLQQTKKDDDETISHQNEYLIKKLELEHREKEREWEFKFRELELQKEISLKQLEASTSNQQSHGLRNNSEFDVTKYLRLVPSFQEQEVEAFFNHFEKLANQMNWPSDKWTLLIQTSFTGKAQQIYSSLSLDECADYEHVKKCILNGYELVPEAYRQKFRSLRKLDSQSHIEFARCKSTLFERWCSSLNVTSIDQLQQLILLEEFKRCIPPEIKIFLDEHKVSKLDDAAAKADEFALTHKHKFTQNKPRQFKNDIKGAKVTQHYIPNSSESSSSDSTRFKIKSESLGSHSDPNSPTCAYCRKKGHLLGDCLKLARKKQLEQSSNALAVRQRHTASANAENISNIVPNRKSNGYHHTSTGPISEEYKPFVSDGLISISDGSTKSTVKIKMLRDTGANLTLILSGMLPLSQETYTGQDELIKGVPGGQGEYISVPLHEIYLQSNLVTGRVTVGVLPTLPADGISCLLGNDLAGNKVTANPIVVENPTTSNSTKDLEQQFPDVFEACAVTRSMSKQAGNLTKPPQKEV